jgi:hypothetical protein
VNKNCVGGDNQIKQSKHLRAKREREEKLDYGYNEREKNKALTSEKCEREVNRIVVDNLIRHARREEKLYRCCAGDN